jgi:hypothetical protein
MFRLTQALNNSEIVRYLASLFASPEPVRARIPVFVETAERQGSELGQRH